MKKNYYIDTPVSITKKYADYIEEVFEDSWRKKARKLQERRWQKLRDREAQGNYGRHSRFQHTAY